MRLVPGRLEALPFPDRSFDAVSSNGVFNLCPDKAQVFREAARVLHPGGRLAAADIVASRALPDSVTCSADLWSACIGGAAPADDYLSWLAAAGLTAGEIHDVPQYHFLSPQAADASDTYGVRRRRRGRCAARWAGVGGEHAHPPRGDGAATWEFTSCEPGIARVCGHADHVVLDGDRVIGVVVSTRSTRETIGADLVVDATGRAGRFTAAYRPQVEGADCGVAYASRLFQLRPGADPGPMNGGPGWMAEHDGFLNIIFVHDAGTFSVLLARLGTDRELTALRDETAYTTALALLPAASEWTDPARAFPIDRVRAGAGLVNNYRPQTRDVTCLLAIGDVVCTTNPTGGRGVTLAVRAAAGLTDLVGTHPAREWAPRLDAWSHEQLRPWFEEHLVFDRAMGARWHGEPLDPDAHISWDLVVAATTQRPDFMPTLGPFLGMYALPQSIDPLRDEVRAMLRSGWRPPTPPGPTRDDIVAAISGSLSTVVS